jgi:NTE family protein
VEQLAKLWLAVSGHDVYPLSRAETLRTLTADLPRHPLRAVTQAVGMRNYTFPFRPIRFVAAALGQGDHLFDNRGLGQVSAAGAARGQPGGHAAAALRVDH